MAESHLADVQNGTGSLDPAQQAELIIEIKGVGWDMAWGPGSDFASYESVVSWMGMMSQFFSPFSLTTLKAMLTGFKACYAKTGFDMEWPEIPRGDAETATDAEVTATTYYGSSGVIIHKEVRVYT